MFSIRIEPDPAFDLQKLSEFAASTETDLYHFRSLDEAKNCLAAHLYAHMKNSIFIRWSAELEWDECHRESFSLCLPSVDIVSLLASIKQAILPALSIHGLFNIPGFIRFRLKEERQVLEKIMTKTLREFIPPPLEPSTMASLRQVLHSQPPLPEDLSLIVNHHDELIIRSRTKLYRAEPLTEEDFVISHLILLAPPTLRVYDERNILSYTMKVILKQVFQERVAFIFDAYTSC